jgi:hypothetical protein
MLRGPSHRFSARDAVGARAIVASSEATTLVWTERRFMSSRLKTAPPGDGFCVAAVRVSTPAARRHNRLSLQRCATSTGCALANCDPAL